MQITALINLLIWVQIGLGLVGIVMLVRIIYIATTFLHGDVPFVPTQRKVAKKIAELAELKPGMQVCDLGSGSGTILIALANNQPSANYTGFEISKMLCLATRLRLILHPKARRAVTIKSKDFFNLDFSSYDVITCFLLGKILDRLYPQFLALKPGSKIISHMFILEKFDGFSLQEIPTSRKKDFIFVYTRLPY